jgi:hypothetical protein
MIDRVVKLLSALELTIVCLALALILVFAGTIAQVHLGLYAVQAQYFHSYFVYWTPPGSHLKIPVLPGGWLVGLVLVVNLLAAHIRRFRFVRTQLGILLVHAGLILLLVGQFFTEILQVESQMRLEVGASKNYAEDSRRVELAVIDVTNPDRDDVTGIPQSALEKGGDIRVPGLPFTVRVNKYFANSLPAGPMSGEGEKLKARDGLGQRLFFSAAPATARMDDENKPSALLEVVTDKGPVGQWTVSTWMTKHPWVAVLQEQVGSLLNLSVEEPQSFSVNGHTYQIALRPVRYYKPYSITLLQFKHDTYAGTDIPSNFASKVHLSDPSRGEDRDVLIFMNSPLRYRGETYYQASFESGDRVSILQVVRNPASIIPYVACGVIGGGLVIQFLMHLFRFARNRAAAAKRTGVVAATGGDALRPVPVGGSDL